MNYIITYQRKVRRLVHIGPLFCPPTTYAHFDWKTESVTVPGDQLDAKMTELLRDGCMIGTIDYEKPGA